MNKLLMKKLLVTGMSGGNTGKIYGVSWTKVESPVLTRTDDAVGMVAAAGVGSGTVTNDFDTAEIYKDITSVTDSYGNEFMRIPKFYIKQTDSANLHTWQVSKKQYPGFYLPWCFWDFTNGRELNYVDIGKYPANLNATKLESKSGTFPLVSTNIVNFRAYAQANGTGYQQLDLHTYDAITTLFTVEFANLNAQAIMKGFDAGAWSTSYTATVAETAANRIIVANANAAAFAVGQTIGIGTSLGGNQVATNRVIESIDFYDANNKAIVFDGAAVNIAIGNIVYSLGWKNGACSTVVASSGGLTSNTNGKSPFKYRGIENLWANIWQFVDGVNINERQAWVCLNSASYASNLFAEPYKQLGYVNGSSDGYIKDEGFDPFYPFAQFPIAVGGAADKYFSDFYYQTAGQRIAFVGGFWGSGALSGPSCWSLYNTSSDAYINIGGRLLRKAL